jgi:microcystin-dependent protein
MAEPFLSEIRLFSFGFAAKGWALCNGQLLPINQNQALFSLLGTTYGGDGRVNFALPNLRGQVPIGYEQGPGLSNYALGQTAGEIAHTLLMSEMPVHTHPVTNTLAVTAACDTGVGTSQAPTNNLPAAGATPAGTVYSNAAANAQMSAAAIEPGGSVAVANVGGSQSHPNLQPFLVINFCIALQGIFPSQT